MGGACFALQKSRLQSDNNNNNNVPLLYHFGVRGPPNDRLSVILVTGGLLLIAASHIDDSICKSRRGAAANASLIIGCLCWICEGGINDNSFGIITPTLLLQ